jgi:protocatechuate 3,4-dioxygenase beta subunit
VTLDPPYLVPAYESTKLRAPVQPLVPRPAGDDPAHQFKVDPMVDLTAQHNAAPLGERIAVAGRLLDGNGEPIAGQLVELWQANAAGRYAHAVDDHDAPLDPNFTGEGRVLTGADGSYRFVTIKPGAYPWRNHTNAWRPAHLHFSVFGRSALDRLVTQMYFPGDPLLEHDPIYNALADDRARACLVSQLDLSATVPAFALAYHFDIVVGGRAYR